MRDYFGRGEITFLFPLDGDCLNSADGKIMGGELLVPVRVRSRAEKMSTNGVLAKKNGEEFIAEIPICFGEMILEAVSSSGNKAKISVRRLRHAEKGYRLSSDDNILFLKDIAEHAQEYHSVFENPYLALYREAHEKYGAKVHLNLFYETKDLKGFTPDPPYFNLSMMPDTFRKEWEENANWLNLSFHSRKEYPSFPYRNADAETVVADCLAVHREIVRFAGEKTLAHETTIHFGEVTPQAVSALRQVGYRYLAGCFDIDGEGRPHVSYCYPTEFVTHIGARDFWYDRDFDVTYAKIDCIVNLATQPQTNVAELEKAAQDAYRGGFLEFMIHEQYFYPEYSHYIPKFREIVLECCKYASEHGYTGRFLEEAES